VDAVDVQADGVVDSTRPSSRGRDRRHAVIVATIKPIRGPLASPVVNDPATSGEAVRPARGNQALVVRQDQVGIQQERGRQMNRTK